jgi:hypothetical protein
MLQVVFESDSSSLGLPYNVRAHIVTYDDLIETGAQGKPATCIGDQDDQVLRYQ